MVFTENQSALEEKALIFEVSENGFDGLISAPTGKILIANKDNGQLSGVQISINGTQSSDKNNISKSLGILREVLEHKESNSIKQFTIYD